MKTFAFDPQDLKVSEKKPYFVDEYAHVLKALAEGKPVYYSFEETPLVPEAALKSVALGQLAPHYFSTEKPRPDIPIDAPVWVKISGWWSPMHFAGYHPKDTRPMCWVNGATSHSLRADGYEGKIVCDEVSLSKPEGVK